MSGWKLVFDSFMLTWSVVFAGVDFYNHNDFFGWFMVAMSFGWAAVLRYDINTYSLITTEYPINNGKALE